MIKITVELISAIHPSRNKVIGQMVITNDGTSNTLKRGNYYVSVLRRGSLTRVWRTGLVSNFPRRSKSVWFLLRAALNDILNQ